MGSLSDAKLIVVRPAGERRAGTGPGGVQVCLRKFKLIVVLFHMFSSPSAREMEAAMMSAFRAARRDPA